MRPTCPTMRPTCPPMRPTCPPIKRPTCPPRVEIAVPDEFPQSFLNESSTDSTHDKHRDENAGPLSYLSLTEPQSRPLKLCRSARGLCKGLERPLMSPHAICRNICCLWKGLKRPLMRPRNRHHVCRLWKGLQRPLMSLPSHLFTATIFWIPSACSISIIFSVGCVEQVSDSALLVIAESKLN